MTLKHTALYSRHQAHGAKLVEYAGFAMPLQYTGILQEHDAVRRGAGVFDVSHMDELLVRGPQALDFLQYLLPNDTGPLALDQVLYSCMCYPDGGTVDDLLVYRRPDHFLPGRAGSDDGDFRIFPGFDFRHITLLCFQVEIPQKTLNRVDRDGFVDLIALALGLTRMRADPAANGRKGAREFDEFQGLLKFSLDGKAHKSLDIDMGGAPHLARGGLLFFSSGLAYHRVASITLLAIHKNDAGFWVLGNRILRTSEGTGRIFTMVTKQGLEIGSPLDRLDDFRADTNPMFLFASHFTGMATHALYSFSINLTCPITSS